MAVCTRGILASVVLVLVLVNHVLAEACYLNTTACEPITTSMCLTTKVTFTHTSLIYTNKTLSQSDILDQLSVWQQLEGVPECWNLIQPYLCSVYLPKCDPANTKVFN